MAAPAQPAPGTGWSITNQTATVGKVGDQVTNGWSISYLTGRGHEGKIFVPLTQYTPDVVRGLITTAATNADTIGALTG